MNVGRIEFEIKKSFVAFAISFTLGILVLLNQFGSYFYNLIEKLFTSTTKMDAFWKTKNFSWIWEVNLYLSDIDYVWIVVVWFVLLLANHFVFDLNKQLQQSHLKGLLTGFLFFPLLILIISACYFAFKLFSLLLMLLNKIIPFLMIPIIWLFQKIIIPIIYYLSMPFMWIWDNFLKIIFEYIMIPFKWFWSTVLEPLFYYMSLLFKWFWSTVLEPLFYYMSLFFVWLWQSIIKPLLLFIWKYLKPFLFGLVILFVCSFIALPFALIGRVVISSIKLAIQVPITPSGAFAQGVGLGFITFDILLMYSLGIFDVVVSYPSITVLAALLVPAIFLVRSIYKLNRWSKLRWNDIRYNKMLFVYWKAAKLDLVCTVVAIPLIVIGSIFFAPED